MDNDLIMNNRCSDAQINWLVIAKNQTRNRELLSPSKRRAAAKAVVDKYRISERRACRIIGQPRSSQRYKAVKRAEEDEITAQIVELASTYGRYGYRMITAMLHGRGYHINHKRVYRIWRTLGLKVPQKQPKRKRLWLNDGSCIRLRAEYPNHVWSYDFVETRTSKGRKIKILNIIGGTSCIRFIRL